jgi:predicted metal-binding membrane protein
MKPAAVRSGYAATTNTINSPRSAVNRRSASARQGAFLATSALVFIVCVAVTLYENATMSGSMAMPGGWLMSMPWMRMPDQNWFAAACSFIGMWIVMMTAMMAPVLVVTLLRFRRRYSDSDATRVNALTALAASGYLFVWAVVGAVIYPFGLAAAAATTASPTLSRLIPVTSGAILLLAGCLQLTKWKTRMLCRCRQQFVNGPKPSVRFVDAWRAGTRMGTACATCCSALMVVPLVTGVMNLVTMAAVALAISAERHSRQPKQVVWIIGVLIVAFGLFVLSDGARGLVHI